MMRQLNSFQTLFSILLILGWFDTYAYREGQISQVVLDSTYLASSDSLGFQFDRQSKKKILDLNELAQHQQGVTYESHYYRAGKKSQIGLPLIEMPGEFSVAELVSSHSEDTAWDVSMYSLEDSKWMGSQHINNGILEAITLLGAGQDQLGWLLLEKGKHDAWIFEPDSLALSFPGKVSGVQVVGTLKIGEPLENKLTFKNSDQKKAWKVRIQFIPKSIVRWECGTGGCTSTKLEDAIQRQKWYSINKIIFWSQTYGLLAEFDGVKSDSQKIWNVRWLSDDTSKVSGDVK